MLVIGLTGGIGSGKSMVADLFAERGVPIIDADIIAREVTQAGSPAAKEIVSRFGTLDRAVLREKIFAKPAERIWLENLLHPLILQRINELIDRLNAPYCIVVIPLLFETGTDALLNRILLVDVPEDVQIARASKRDGVPPEQVKAIMQTQASREERRVQADDIVVNDSSVEALEREVLKLHEKYLAMK